MYETTAPHLRGGRERWLQEGVLPALASIAEIRLARTAYRREDVETIVSEYEAAGVDALLVVNLTYSPSQIALPALKRTRLPIVVWNTQELASVDEHFESKFLGENHGVHGTQDLCSALVRTGVPFEYVTSHISDVNALEALNDYFIAAAATAALAVAESDYWDIPSRAWAISPSTPRTCRPRWAVRGRRSVSKNTTSGLSPRRWPSSNR